jgi:hypothetical protein
MAARTLETRKVIALRAPEVAGAPTWGDFLVPNSLSSKPIAVSFQEMEPNAPLSGRLTQTKLTGPFHLAHEGTALNHDKPSIAWTVDWSRLFGKADTLSPGCH